jgi:peptide/nickel transport system substrate-binding protein
VTLRNLPSTAIEEAYGPDNKYLKSDFFIDEFGSLIDPTFLLSATTCAARGSQNDSGYCNPEYDKKFEEQGKLLDEDARLALIHEMEEDIQNVRSNLFIAWTSSLEAHYKGWEEDAFKPVLGMSMSFINADFLVNVRD